MTYVPMLLLGLFGGAVPAYLLTEAKRRSLNDFKRHLDSQAESLRDNAREVELSRKESDQQVRENLRELESRRTKSDQEVQENLRALESRRKEIEQRAVRLEEDEAAFKATIISYKDLQQENAILKRDLQNVDVHLRKLQLDGELQAEAQQTVDRRSNELGSRYLKENVKWITTSLTSNNFASCKQRLQNVVGWCREIGFEIPAEEEVSLIGDLKVEYERVVRAALEREEQARIKARIREEQQLEKEIERELKQLERERAAIQAALEKALAETTDQHSAEVESLKTRLAAAEEKKRAISQAQMTKAGHIYVISNIGAFGEGVFKVGMTRRLEPVDRIRELGDASVPYPFDVHMMISSENAPALEVSFHRAFHKLRVNKANPRKEFFKTSIEAIREFVEKHHGEVQYTADPEALEYRQSLAMTDEDMEFIEGVYGEPDEDSKPVADDA